LQPYLNKEKVEIVLADLKLDRIPVEIGQLKDVKELSISRHKQAWTVYPPMSAMKDRSEQPPFEYIPVELCQLTQLESLTLGDLDLKALPEGFENLDNLRLLNFSMNKMDVASELGKLSKLKSLRKLIVIGNKIDTLAIENFQKANPEIEIQYK
jgi:Leucine-rich repeat (LRR) protein